MGKKKALLLSFLVASASLYIVTGKSSSTCGDGEECQVGPQATENILLQKRGALLQHNEDSRNGAAADFIILGDSWAELAGQALAGKCSGKTVVNRGASGSEAKDWASGTSTAARCAQDACSATSAFSAQYGEGYTHAWLSVGGNDWLGTGCKDVNKAQLITDIKAAIAKVVDAAPFGLRILMTGYGVMSTPCESSEACSSCGYTELVKLQGAIKTAIDESPHKASVLFHDVLEAFGGSKDDYSDDQWYADGIHLNAVGYAKFFGLPVIQTFFGCPGADAETCVTCGGCIYNDECYITYSGDFVNKGSCLEYGATWCGA